MYSHTYAIYNNHFTLLLMKLKEKHSIFCNSIFILLKHSIPRIMYFHILPVDY